MLLAPPGAHTKLHLLGVGMIGGEGVGVRGLGWLGGWTDQPSHLLSHTQSRSGKPAYFEQLLERVKDVPSLIGFTDAATAHYSSIR